MIGLIIALIIFIILLILIILNFKKIIQWLKDL